MRAAIDARDYDEVNAAIAKDRSANGLKIAGCCGAMLALGMFVLAIVLGCKQWAEKLALGEKPLAVDGRPQCSKCGGRLDGMSEVCPHCHVKLVSPKAASPQCPACGGSLLTLA